jgi:NADPH2:quinone reductase
MRGIQITELGGPEQLVVGDLPEPVPGPGERVFDVLAAGVNYADTHQTEGSYLSRTELPLIPGGEVVVRGDGGARLLGLVGSGGYAERIALDPARLIPVPDGVSNADALAVAVQGATAWHLLRTCARLAEGESVVVHAGAGGTGSIAIQLARRWGAGRVIATASGDEKRKLTLDLGADAAVDSTTDDLAGALREANGGQKVDVVLEMAGGRVFDQSLAALAPFGRLVHFGQASRTAPEPVAPGTLMHGSKAVIGFWLVHTLARPGMYAAAVTDLFAAIAGGAVRTVAGGTYPLERAADAHRDLRERRTTGKLVLTVAD